MWSKEDTVLFKIPDAIVVLAVEETMKGGVKIIPLNGITLTEMQESSGLTGPLYATDEGVITAEELSWFLRKGYVKSVLVGEIGNVAGSQWPSEQTGYLKPRVEYTITEFGKSCGRWY